MPTVEFDVVHEDDDVLVIDKPAGLVVHPGVGQRRRARSCTACWLGTPTSRGWARSFGPGIVHRLDRDTSGLMLVARTADALDVARRGAAVAHRHPSVPHAGVGPRRRAPGHGRRPDRPVAPRARPGWPSSSVVARPGPPTRSSPATTTRSRTDAAHLPARDRPHPPDQGPPAGHRPRRGRRHPVWRRPPVAAGRRVSSCTPSTWRSPTRPRGERCRSTARCPPISSMSAPASAERTRTTPRSRSARRTLALFAVALLAVAVGGRRACIVGARRRREPSPGDAAERSTVTDLGPGPADALPAYLGERRAALHRVEGRRGGRGVAAPTTSPRTRLSRAARRRGRRRRRPRRGAGRRSPPGADRATTARARRRRRGRDRRSSEIGSPAPTVEDPEFAAFYRAELDPLPAGRRRRRPDDVVFGVSGGRRRCADLRALASRPAAVPAGRRRRRDRRSPRGARRRRAAARGGRSARGSRRFRP